MADKLGLSKLRLTFEVIVTNPLANYVIRELWLLRGLAMGWTNQRKENDIEVRTTVNFNHPKWLSQRPTATAQP